MHGGNLLTAMEQYGKEKFIDLSANINPFGPPEGVWEAIQLSLSEIVHYPDPEYRRLRRRISQQLAIPEEEVLLGNGAGELIFLLLHSLKPKKVLIPDPAFGEYERAARACGAEVQRLTLGVSGWNTLSFANPDSLSQWEKGLAENDLVFINSPHNPTGSSLTGQQFTGLLNMALQHKTWVVLDESFVDFLEDEKRWSGREYLKSYSNLLVLYSLTKFYSIPGLRLGAVFGDPKVLNILKEQRDPWAVNCLAEGAGLAALAEDEYAPRVRKLLKEGKDFFYQEFEGKKFSLFELFPSEVNFSLIRIVGQGKQTGSREISLLKGELIRELGGQGVLVRDCGNFYGLEGEFIRVAIKDKYSMKSLLEVMKGFETRVGLSPYVD